MSAEPATSSTSIGTATYTKRVLIALAIIGTAIVFGQFVMHAIWAFLVLAAGILFGIFLHDLSAWIARHTPLRYSWSLGLVVLVLLALAAGFLFYLGNSLVSQVNELGTQLTSAAERLYRQAYEQLQGYEWLRQYLPEERPSANSLAPKSGLSPSNVMSNVAWVANQVMWFLGIMVVIFFTGLYLAADPGRYKKGIIKLIPLTRRGRAQQVLHKLHEGLGRWILARIISMTIIGILTAVGLWLLGVPLAIALGVLSALLTFVPNVGPIVALVPQTLLALQVGPSTALYVILFNVALQTVESYLITPLIEQFEVTLPPVLTITMQMALGVLFGAMGLVLASPLEVVGLVLVQMLYIQDVLGDPSPGELVDHQTT